MRGGGPGWAGTVLEFVLHNWALFLIGATVVVLVVVPELILRKYLRIMFNIVEDTPPPLSIGPRDFPRIGGEEVQFRAFDGLSLRGMIIPGDPMGARRGMILFAHEFASDRFSWARYCRHLQEAGYDIFAFDFRGHGDSSHEPGYQPRQWVTDREVNDMLGAIAFAEDYLDRQGRPMDVGIFGISRGAGAGIIASMHNARVRAIVADGAFSSDTTLEYYMQRWVHIFAKVRVIYENHPPAFWRFLRWRLIRLCRKRLGCEFLSVRKALMRSLPRPILFIHGERDSYIPAEQARWLYNLASHPKYLWIVPEARHNQAVAVCPALYAQRTLAFFNRYLDTSPAGGAAEAPGARGAGPHGRLRVQSA